ncbi:MAG: hypothetical protein WCO33_04120 [bacterium]
MDYSGVLSHTFHNWWKFKKYWLIAFIALFNPFLFSVIGTFMFLPKHTSGLVIPEIASSMVVNTQNQDQFMTTTGIVFIISLIIYVFYVLIIGNMFIAGIMKGYAVSGETGKAMGILETLKQGSKYWLKLIAQKLLISSPLIIVMVIYFFIIFGFVFVGSASGAPSKGDSGIAGLFALLLCCFYIVIFILAFLIQVTYEISARYLVVEDKGFFEAIRSGINFTRKNIGIVFVSVLLLIVLAFLVYLIVLIPSMISSIFIVISAFIIPTIVNTDPVIGTILFFVTTGIASLVYIFALSLSLTLNISFWNSLFIKFKEYKEKSIVSK